MFVFSLKIINFVFRVFGESCSVVEEKLVSQIKLWSDSTCDLKQQCQYKV